MSLIDGTFYVESFNWHNGIVRVRFLITHSRPYLLPFNTHMFTNSPAKKIC